MKIDINLPTIISVDDYHEFNYLEETLKKFIPKVHVKEGGFYCGDYHAVVYIGKQTQKVKELLRETQKREQQYYKEMYGDE